MSFDTVASREAGRSVRILQPASIALLLALWALIAGRGSLSAGSSVEIQVLSLSGWRGQIEPLAGGVGGAATLAAYWQQDRNANANTLILGVGNSFGTSPPVANAFQDRPSIEVLNALGVDADTLGNDNFDAGLEYVQRLIDLAEFPFLAANLGNREGNLTGVDEYAIFGVGGIRVAVIGVTDPQSPERVFPGNFGTIEVTNPVLAAMEAREEAERAGADVFILITEMGFTSIDGEQPAGPLYELASRVDGFDLILGDESDLDLQTTVNGALVVESRSRGASYARTTLVFAKDAGTVVSAQAEFVEPLLARVEPDAKIAALVASYAAKLADSFGAVIGSSDIALRYAGVCGGPDGRICESLAGSVVADALRKTYATDIALINSGAIRADLTCATASLAGFCPEFSPPPLPITVGQIEAALPFGNFAVVATLSGRQLKGYLENSVSQLPEPAGRFAQVSGLCFTYDLSRPHGSRVVSAAFHDAALGCSGDALDLSDSASYSLATIDFVAAGGDGYEPLGGELRERLSNVVQRYLASGASISDGLTGRITCISGGGQTCPSVEGAAEPVADPGSIQPPSAGNGGLQR